MKKINILIALLGFAASSFIKAPGDISKMNYENSISATLKQAKETIESDSAKLIGVINENISLAKKTSNLELFKRYLDATTNSVYLIRTEMELGDAIKDFEKIQSNLQSILKQIEELDSRASNKS